MSDKLKHFAELRAAFETMKCAGWITDYDITSANPVIHWTDHGRQRAVQMLAIHDDLDIGAYDYPVFVAAAKFLLPDKLGHGGN